MVNKCVAHGCKTGYASEKKEQHEEEEMDETGENTNDIATFHFPNKDKYPDLRAKWVRWVNRKDFETATNSNVICEGKVYIPGEEMQTRDGHESHAKQILS